MRLWLRWLWLIFKWAMVLLGTVSAYLALSRKPTEEVFLLGKTECEFSFNIPQGAWAPDPNAAAYANIPVMVRRFELASPQLFLSMNRFWRDDKSPGGWSFVTQDKCQLTTKDVIRTADGKEARVFLASSCDVSRATRNGRIESPFREHTLYGYVVYNDREADFLYLSSSDRALVLKHEDLLLSAFKSYSTNSPACVARRTTVKKLEISK